MLLKSHTESLGGFKSQYMHTEDTDHHQFCPVLQFEIIMCLLIFTTIHSSIWFNCESDFCIRL